VSLAVGLLILVVLAVPLGWAIYRSNELFCVDVVAGKARLVRGRVPQRLFDDVVEVVKTPRVDAARIRVVTEDGHPRVMVAKGNVSEGQLQQLRNVVGTFRIAEIRAGRRAR